MKITDAQLVKNRRSCCQFSLYKSTKMDKYTIKRSYLRILLLCILSLGALAQELHDFTAVRMEKGNAVYHSKTHCSRERSRIAWKIIDEYLMPFVEEENYNLSRTCRLHAANDMFREQELHKDHLRVNEWQCGFCQKIFLSENFLEQHFDNRHQNLLNISWGNCLADMCGALHCDLMDKSKPPKTKCNLAAVDKNHHLCESLANSCFPTSEGPSARRLHDFFSRQFCDAHTCKKGSRPFTRGAGKKISLWYYAICILVMMMLPIFYCIVYMHQREMSKNVKNLKRISKMDKGKSY